MTELDRFRHVPESPTLPRGGRPSGTFDVADLYRGPLDDGVPPVETEAPGLDEKLRQTYFWITNQAVISPMLDIEFHDGPPTRLVFGERRVELSLPNQQSYSSQVLLPLLNLVVGRRCLLAGAAGQGKTTIANLMRLLAPGDDWVGLVDGAHDDLEGARSALADQGPSGPGRAWFATVDDDGHGGGADTIRALRDHTDLVVRAQPFNPRFLGEVLDRLEAGVRPEECLPDQLVFTTDELSEIEHQVRTVRVPPPVRRRLEFLASQFEFHEAAGRRFDTLTKGGLRLSTVDAGTVEQGATPTDPIGQLGAQSLNGIAVPDLANTLLFAKALAWFRGEAVITLTDLRQVLPFVLADKLDQNPDSPAFDHGIGRSLLADPVSWMRGLFDATCREYDRLGLDDLDPVAELHSQFHAGLESIDEAEVDRRLAAIESKLQEISESEQLHGHLHVDVLALAYLHQRYVNYRSWLRWSG
ncbi:MAG: ATPase [Actinomycetia bacterium]|nr:ATPase [Actinomycetes bacterium]MCP3912514.1 ATPase [Actinomycetes bacterium]MCP4086681.1 ATPase [Actinomycetes bacterium]